MARAFLLLFGAFACAARVHAQPAPEPATMLAEVKAIEVRMLAPVEHDRVLEASYRGMRPALATHALDGYGNDDVERAWEVASTATFYLPRPDYVDDLRRALDELERRGLASAERKAVMMGRYMAARMLAEAAAFAPDVERSGAAFEPLPAFTDASVAGTSGPTLWSVSADAKRVVRQGFPLADGVRVVVVGAPGCHFSQSAARDIAIDAGLSAQMQAHAIWLLPQGAPDSFAAVAAWNHDHPTMHMRIAYRRDEWPQISNWATPVFYFFKDGQLLEQVTGWPGRARLDALRAAFRKVGVD